MISALEVLVGFFMMLGLMFLGAHVATAMMAAAVLGAMAVSYTHLTLPTNTVTW